MTQRKRQRFSSGLAWLLAALFGWLLWRRWRRERAQPPVLEQEAASPEGTAPGRVSLNGASLDDLQTLPGVGPVLAERIAAGRPYRSVEALLEVEGIGEVTFRALAPRLEL